MKYTLKQDGKYYTGQGASRGFFAHGIGACYSFTLEEARALKAKIGGEIVEVLKGAKPFSSVEGQTVT